MVFSLVDEEYLDANGNILTQVRKGSAASNLAMDNLSYVYDNGRNRLKGVNDAEAGGLYLDDVEAEVEARP